MADPNSPMWFIYSNEVVSGPFDTATLRAKLQSGEVQTSSFVWWKGHREWLPIANWESQIESITSSLMNRNQKSVWYIENTGKQLGPLTETELIANLKGIPQLNRIHLWTVGMKQWASIYELPDIMELLGVSRRVNERAPLMGTAAVSRSNDDPKGFFLKTASISAEGVGVSGQHDLRTGDWVSVVIKSKELSGTLHLHGRVSYVTSNNYAGIHFQNALPEAQSVIFDYVKRFNAATAEPKKKSQSA